MNKTRILAAALIVMLLANITVVSALIHTKSKLRETVTQLSQLQKEINGEEDSGLLTGEDEPEEETISIEKKEPSKKTTSTEIQTEDSLLEDNIRRSIAGTSGSWDIWAESLSTASYAHVVQGSGDSMVSASLIKLFIMGAAFQEVYLGNISDNAVHQDIWNMITVSDNDAANRVISTIGNGSSESGIAKVNAFISSIGCTGSQLNRLMLEENGKQNYTTAEDCARILRLIYNGQCINEDYSEIMMDCLKGQNINDRIPLGVPTSVTVAHKTGNLVNLCNGDVGIVLTPDVDYILCVINNDSVNDSQTNADIVRVSESVYNYLVATS